MKLKSTPEQATHDLTGGDQADWLGYRLGRGEGELKISLTEKAWTSLAGQLELCHEKDNSPQRAAEAVLGWVNQMGPCLSQTDVNVAYARVGALAQSLAFDELPSPGSFVNAGSRPTRGGRAAAKPGGTSQWSMRRLLESRAPAAPGPEPMPGGWFSATLLPDRPMDVGAWFCTLKAPTSVALLAKRAKPHGSVVRPGGTGLRAGGAPPGESPVTRNGMASAPARAAAAAGALPNATWPTPRPLVSSPRALTGSTAGVGRASQAPYPRRQRRAGRRTAGGTRTCGA
jgi:hypothetical protein